jgi:hypothetical protein
MVINQDHVQSLLRQLPNDASNDDLLQAAAEYDDHVASGRTMKDPGTGQNISSETLAEVARALRERVEGVGVPAEERTASSQLREDAKDRGIGKAL